MLLVNDVYCYGSKCFRILWLNADMAYWIDIKAKGALPKAINVTKLNALINAQTIEAIADPDEEFVISPPSKSSEWGKKIQAEGWALISNYVNQEPDIYDRAARGKIIRAILEANVTTKQTVYAKLRNYWQKGKSPSCLYPDTRKNGGTGKTKAAGDKKRGRPRTITIGVGANITEEIAVVFRSIIKTFYSTTKQNTLQFAYDKALKALGVKPKEITVEELAEYPTYEQFYYFMRKETNAVELARKRAGDIQYYKDMRPVLGTSAAEVMGPGSLYQIDATIADIYLLSEHDRTKIVGRPTLYVVIDVFSRLVTGIHIGFESPSWVSAMHALANTMMDKVEYCASHGIDISHSDWPVKGKPEAILGDKGEMLGHTVEVLSQAFHIDIQNTPSHRADWKGVVERHFRTLQAKFQPYVEGYVTGDIGVKRGGHDYRLDAELTLSEFTRLVIACVVEYNTSHAMKNYDPDKDMPPDLPHNPLALWNWGISHRTGKLRGVKQDLAMVNLLPHTKASVTEEGIGLFKCRYSNALAIKEGWFHRFDTDRPDEVIVAYHPYSTNKIYLRLKGQYDSYVICELTERSREYRDLTFWDVWRINDIKAKTASRANLTKQKGRQSLDETIEEITSKAREKNPDMSDASKASRLKGIRENRTEEVARHRRSAPDLISGKSKKPKEDNVVYINSQKPMSYDIPDMVDDLFGEDD